MSAPAPPFSRGEATPQSIQKLLDENAQLIRAIVENMSVKGKAMESIQYQQMLHRNLVYLASMADPSLNIQAILPPPGSNLMQSQRALSSQALVTSSAPYTMAPPTSSMHLTTAHQQLHRQPNITMTTGASSSQAQWSSSQSQSMLPASMSSSMRQAQPGQPLPPPPGHMPSQYGGVAGTKGYGGGMWVGQSGQMVPYPGMPSSRQMAAMQEERRRQLLRMQQEQLIQAQQAQQARRMQQQQGQVSSMGPSPMYHPPPGPGMMPGMAPAHMPPGYPQSSSMSAVNPAHSMPPGPMNM